jgi:hypothetical protein
MQLFLKESVIDGVRQNHYHRDSIRRKGTIVEHDQDDNEPSRVAKPRASINLGAFLLAFLFVWLVFDNVALGLIVALFVGGGSEVAQRTVNKKFGNGDRN